MMIHFGLALLGILMLPAIILWILIACIRATLDNFED